MSICDNLLNQGIEIEHACEKSCACTTCHVIVREGLPSLSPSTRGRGRPARPRMGPDAAVAALVPGDRRRHAAQDRDSALHDQLRQGKDLTRLQAAIGPLGDQSMKWTDTRDIAIALAEAHPDVDPRKRALHRSARVGAWRCPALRTTRGTAAKRSSRRSRWRGSTKAIRVTTDRVDHRPLCGALRVHRAGARDARHLSSAVARAPASATAATRGSRARSASTATRSSTCRSRSCSCSSRSSTAPGRRCCTAAGSRSSAARIAHAAGLARSAGASVGRSIGVAGTVAVIVVLAW